MEINKSAPFFAPIILLLFFMYGCGEDYRKQYGVLALALVICLGGCESQFVKLRIEGAMPEPTIHLARKFSIAQFGVEKIIPVKGQDNDKVEYWGGVAKSAKDEVYTSEIRYGQAPEGFNEYPSARPLDYGYYSIYIAASAHRIAGGAFLILRDKVGKLSIVNISSHNYGNEFITCVDDAMYYEDAVKSHCFSQEQDQSSLN